MEERQQAAKKLQVDAANTIAAGIKANLARKKMGSLRQMRAAGEKGTAKAREMATAEEEESEGEKPPRRALPRRSKVADDSDFELSDEVDPMEEDRPNPKVSLKVRRKRTAPPPPRRRLLCARAPRALRSPILIRRVVA